MKQRPWIIAGAAGVALAGTTLTLTLNSNAQDGRLEPVQQPPAAAGPRNVQGGQGFPPNAPGQGFQGQPGQGRPGQGGFGGMGGGGAAAITSDNAWLYIVQGGMVFKVNKADLKVVGASPLMGGMEFGQGRPGQPDRPGQRGGGTPPPPPSAK